MDRRSRGAEVKSHGEVHHPRPGSGTVTYYWKVSECIHCTGSWISWVLVSASVLSFVTLFYWVLQTMTIVTAMLIVISFVIVIAMILTVFVISMGYGRNRY